MINDDWADQIIQDAELEADGIVADFPGTSLEDLALGLERSLDAYDSGPEFGKIVIDVLRRRASKEKSGRVLHLVK